MSQQNAALTSQGPRNVEPPGIAAEPVDPHEHQCLLWARSPMEHANITPLLWLNFHFASGENVYFRFAPQFKTLNRLPSEPISCRSIILNWCRREAGMEFVICRRPNVGDVQTCSGMPFRLGLADPRP